MSPVKVEPFPDAEILPDASTVMGASPPKFARAGVAARRTGTAVCPAVKAAAGFGETLSFGAGATGAKATEGKLEAGTFWTGAGAGAGLTAGALFVLRKLIAALKASWTFF